VFWLIPKSDKKVFEYYLQYKKYDWCLLHPASKSKDTVQKVRTFGQIVPLINSVAHLIFQPKKISRKKKPFRNDNIFSISLQF